MDSVCSGPTCFIKYMPISSKSLILKFFKRKYAIYFRKYSSELHRRWLCLVCLRPLAANFIKILQFWGFYKMKFAIYFRKHSSELHRRRLCLVMLWICRLTNDRTHHQAPISTMLWLWPQANIHISYLFTMHISTWESNEISFDGFCIYQIK